MGVTVALIEVQNLEMNPWIDQTRAIVVVPLHRNLGDPPSLWAHALDVAEKRRSAFSPQVGQHDFFTMLMRFGLVQLLPVDTLL